MYDKIQFMEVRECLKCNQVKCINEFYKHKRSPEGISSSCKSCTRPTSLQYYHKNKYKITQNNREYYSKEENIEKRKKYWKKYGPQRIENDPIYKLRVRLSSSLSRTLKKYSINKQDSTLDLLGMPISEFAQYIESKWVKGYMNWENYGEIWELDHIKGIINFDLTNELQLKECWHYTNFQPLFKTTTIIDGVKFEGNRNKPKLSLEF